MVFSSIPAYLDPANWQQQPNHQTGTSTGVSTQFAPPQAQPPPPPQPHGSGGGSAGSIRPGSMADRARMANIPMPEAALKCPRCESSNTKFCYFNNYSLSQPRHFCKTCRRYWTRGGALRNVPVGGGCRRNKRSKGASSSSSKSPVNSTDRQTASGNNSTSTMSCNNSGGASDMLGLGPQIPQLRFMTPNLHHHFTSEFPSGDIGLNYGSLTAPPVANELNFGGSLFSSLSGLDQWRLQQHHQQFPFLGGLDSSSSSSPSGLYPFESVEASGYGVGASAGQIRPKISSTGVVSQFAAAAASVKMEEGSAHHHHHHHQQQQQQQQQQELNLSRQFLGMHGNEHQYWSSTTGGAGGAGGAAAAWTDLSSFSSSSTSNPL